ncbi:MAG: hypothetical protein WC807_21245 [Hyphomicrobium sp.]|jgi:hypothetical protein
MKSPGDRRENILARLSELAPTADRHVFRLKRVTRAFLETSLFADAVNAGWSDTELFGMPLYAPLVRVDQQGLISGLAVSALSGPKLTAISRTGARIDCLSGGVLRCTRASHSLCGPPWWEHPDFGAVLQSAAAEAA